MALPQPEPGLVLNFSYLWRDEALRGLEEGRKDRPCVVVLSVRTDATRLVVIVAPITHSPPRDPSHAIEIPLATKRRLGLDMQRSWVMATDLNRFVWPGVDLRPTRRGSTTYSYGELPAALYRRLRDQVLALARAGPLTVTDRQD